jgi:hypothetical protein
MQWWILSSNCKVRAKGRAFHSLFAKQIKCKLFISWSVIYAVLQHERTRECECVIQLFLLKGTVASDYSRLA